MTEKLSSERSKSLDRSQCSLVTSVKYNKIAHTVGEVAPKLPIFTKAIEDLISEKQFTEQSFV